VLVSRELKRFDLCKVHLELVKKRSRIEAKGRIVWIVPTQGKKSQKKCFDTGIEFLDIDEASKERIREFIELKAVYEK